MTLKGAILRLIINDNLIRYLNVLEAEFLRSLKSGDFKES